MAVYEETEWSYPQGATRFQVSESSVRRCVKQWRDTGMVEPNPTANGRHPAIDDVGVTVLAAFIKTQSDASQDELRAQLAVHTGTFVRQPTICRTLQRARITRKKRRNAPPNRNGKTSTRLAKPLRKS